MDYGRFCQRMKCGIALVRKAAKIALPYSAGCTSSLPAFVSQHAAKKPVRNPPSAAVIKAGS
jgi:hypothetical protein